VPCHRINKLGTRDYHRDRNAAAAIFANETYFLDNPRNIVWVLYSEVPGLYLSHGTNYTKNF
jgi:hypothetical protein